MQWLAETYVTGYGHVQCKVILYAVYVVPEGVLPCRDVSPVLSGGVLAKFDFERLGDGFCACSHGRGRQMLARARHGSLYSPVHSTVYLWYVVLKNTASA